jgi:hypothetical protein
MSFVNDHQRNLIGDWKQNLIVESRAYQAALDGSKQYINSASFDALSTARPFIAILSS